MTNTNSMKLAPHTRPDLNEADASRTPRLTKSVAAAALPKLAAELQELQDLLYAAGRNSLLVILQGMDTSGKDGTVKHVMDPVNPVGVMVHSFKAPTSDELAHGYLWRVHARTPPRGVIGIFNRSHYEEVLIVRVHELVPRDVWSRRYRQINEFERYLVENDTILLKFFLHISKKEQEERLLAREQSVEKAWKMSPDDWREREHWTDYLDAYRDAVEKTGTSRAPWYVIPADKKWARNHFILKSIVEELRPYKKVWYEALETMGKARRDELEKYRASLAQVRP